MRSFHEYRLAENTSGIQPGSIDDLQRQLEVSIESNVDELVKTLRNRDLNDNPINIMRKSLPWWRRLRNWWSRNWHGDETAESTEQKDDLLFEQHIDELVLLVEGPVNDVINGIEKHLLNFRDRVIHDLRTKFADFKSGKLSPQTTTTGSPSPSSATTPTGSPAPTASGSTTTTTSGTPSATPASPGTSTSTTQAGAPSAATSTKQVFPGQPVDRSTPTRSEPTVSTDGDVQVVKTGKYNIVQKVNVKGKEMDVAHVEYDENGKLVAMSVQLPGKHPVSIDVPEKLGDEAKIDYGPANGNPYKIIHSIDRELGVENPEPPDDEGWSYYNADLDNEPQAGDVTSDPNAAEEIRKRQEELESHKKRPIEEKLLEFLSKDSVRPQIKNEIERLGKIDPKEKDKVVNFLWNVGNDVRMILVDKDSNILDDENDLGKLDWIAELDSNDIDKLAKKLEQLDRDMTDMDEDIIPVIRHIFESKENLFRFLLSI